MAKRSAGIVLYRRRAAGLEVLLVHPGGPLWRRRDLGAWSVPKGEIESGEDAEATARREFAEELGVPIEGAIVTLGEVRQRGGKRVAAFAIEGDFDVDTLVSNTFEMEWPPHSGRRQSFPEVDRADWFDLGRARAAILESQQPFLDRLAALVATS